MKNFAFFVKSMGVHVKCKGYIIHGKKPLLILDLAPGSASHEETYYYVSMTLPPPPRHPIFLACSIIANQKKIVPPLKLYIFWHFKSTKTSLPLPDKKN